ncbi:MAG: hypothetical protein FWC15_04385 [Fibromonadales bacterium]|nr:hypothetical protein [Fibromonadales bacterium]
MQRITDITLSCIGNLPCSKSDILRFRDFLIEMEVEPCDALPTNVFCPNNDFHCATAMAVEHLINGGENVATSFCGIGGFAATEEVVMALRVCGVRKTDKTYEFLPEMAKLFQKITSIDIPANKPVIGEKIFHVESGVHVDGILKQPQCYEPYPPEVVGLHRHIVLGKQSGTASIRAKLSELGLQCAEEHIPLILKRVKQMDRVVSEREFTEIVRETA